MEAIMSRNHKLSESEIIDRILSGEKGLFEILVRRNNQTLYRVIRSYIKSNEEIEDLIQNTHLKAYEKLYQFKHTSKYSTWLIRIGINEALARLKDRSKFYENRDQKYDFESNVILKMESEDRLDPEKRMIRIESQQLLENTIDSLSSKYKTVYILREVEEMSIKEISECLNITTSNVKVRLHRARGLLKEKLYEITRAKDIFEFGSSRCKKVTEHVMHQVHL